MKKYLIFIFLIISTTYCTSQLVDKDITTIPETRNNSNISYDSLYNYDGILKIKFSNGEISKETININSSNIKAKLLTDTITLEVSTGVGYVGGHIIIDIIRDSIKINGVKWSCTYQDEYKLNEYKATVNKKI